MSARGMVNIQEGEMTRGSIRLSDRARLHNRDKTLISSGELKMSEG